MKDLTKLVFTKETDTQVPTLTQICAESEDEESDSSDNEVLEFVANWSKDNLT